MLKTCYFLIFIDISIKNMPIYIIKSLKSIDVASRSQMGHLKIISLIKLM